MQPSPPASGRGPRLAAVSLALLALLALVAFASRSGFGHGSNARPTPVFVSYAFTAFLIVFVLMIPVAMYIWVVQAREGPVQRKGFISRVVANILTMIVIGAIIAIAVYIRHHHGHLFAPHTKVPKKPGNIPTPGSKKQQEQFEPTFEWPVLVAALVILIPLAAFVIYQWRTGRFGRRPLPEGDASMTDDFVASISDAIDDLEAEPDARRAVIAAYARMEGVLGRHGLRRRPSETPTEYLRRVLLGLTTRGEDVQTLTGLFEQAKFSRHEIGGGMKQDAITALRAIRDDLQGAPA
jgi:hypothetical protein